MEMKGVNVEELVNVLSYNQKVECHAAIMKGKEEREREEGVRKEGLPQPRRGERGTEG